MGLEATHRSHTNLMPGKEKRRQLPREFYANVHGPCQDSCCSPGSALGRAGWPLHWDPSWTPSRHPQGRVPGESFGTRGQTGREMDPLSSLSSTGHCRGSGEMFNEMYGWWLCQSRAWSWKHLATPLQTRLACECPPWSSAPQLRSANAVRVRPLLCVTVLSSLL